MEKLSIIKKLLTKSDMIFKRYLKVKKQYPKNKIKIERGFDYCELDEMNDSTFLFLKENFNFSKEK